jgi:hypothetical protein
MQEDYKALKKFKEENSCTDCGDPIGIGPGDRKICKQCSRPFCPRYGKGSYDYNTKRGYCVYKCHECFPRAVERLEKCNVCNIASPGCVDIDAGEKYSTRMCSRCDLNTTL